MNLTSRMNQTSKKGSLMRCPSCETPATASSLYCGFCGCDLTPQSEFSWHDDRPGLWSIASFGWEAG